MPAVAVSSDIASGMVDDDGRTSKLLRMKRFLLGPSLHCGIGRNGFSSASSF